ncbi:hypothetical protein KAI52_02505 [Candidatus Parcubacteria bacterium]|nr:hypothetical protein [Candidatus Parcubacteria bacterium]
MRKFIVWLIIVCFFGAGQGMPALANVDFSDEFIDLRKPLAFSIDKGPSNPFIVQEDFFRLRQEITEARAMELMLALSEEYTYSAGNEIINEEIRNFSFITLKYDPVEIFDYVYKIETEFYYGLRNSSIKTLHANRASPWEKCVLLHDLLIVAGYDVFLEEVIMTLTGEEMMSWTGAESPYAAGLMLGKRYIPIIPLNEHFSDFIVMQPRVSVHNMYGDGRTITLDPSYKSHERTEGYSAEIEVGEKTRSIFSSVDSKESILLDPDLVRNALKEQESIFNNTVGNLTPKEFFGSREINQYYPTEKERGVDLDRWKVVRQFSSLPEELMAKIEITMSGGEFFQCSLSELTEELSITYIESSEEGYLPVLKLGAEIVATGTSAGLNETQNIRVGFFEPGKKGWEYSEIKLIAGEDKHVFTPGIQQNEKDLWQEAEKLKSLVDDLDPDQEMPDEAKLKILSLTGKMYCFLSGKSIQNLAKMAKIDNVDALSLVLTSWTNEGVEINVVRDPSMAVSLQETQDNDKEAEVKSWFVIKATICSLYESLTLQSLFKTKAFSTASCFAEAMEQGISVVILENTEDLGKFSAKNEIRNAIRRYLEQGFIIAILERPITTGQAWIVMDKEMKSITFQIESDYGIINGGKTGAIEYSPSKAWFIGVAALELADAIIVSVSMVLAGGVKAGVGYQIMVAGHATELAFLTLPFGIGGVVVGTVFICAAVVVGHKLLGNVHHIVDEHLLNEINDDFNDLNITDDVIDDEVTEDSNIPDDESDIPNISDDNYHSEYMEMVHANSPDNSEFFKNLDDLESSGFWDEYYPNWKDFGIWDGVQGTWDGAGFSVDREIERGLDVRESNLNGALNGVPTILIGGSDSIFDSGSDNLDSSDVGLDTSPSPTDNSDGNSNILDDDLDSSSDNDLIGGSGNGSDNSSLDSGFDSWYGEWNSDMDGSGNEPGSSDGGIIETLYGSQDKIDYVYITEPKGNPETTTGGNWILDRGMGGSMDIWGLYGR